MRKRMTNLRAVLLLCAALGWWGYLYPDLAFNRETVKILTLNEAGEEVLLEDEEACLIYYRRLMQADNAHVRVRFKFLEEINSLLEVLKWDNIIQN